MSIIEEKERSLAEFIRPQVDSETLLNTVAQIMYMEARGKRLLWNQNEYHHYSADVNPVVVGFVAKFFKKSDELTWKLTPVFEIEHEGKNLSYFTVENSGDGSVQVGAVGSAGFFHF